ncbi:amino acid permease [Acinetobacter sp. ANC 3791]|uniref:amino acid permease n=1 Tax=Acinetobacter sp. ANC 3791 TaxID=2529836 RepID=UPI001D195E7F|nr:amino acid permease [Acinetobacter sp. ANC 3791]
MHLEKTLKWTDAFALSMSVSGAIFASFGFALGYLGAITAIFVWVFAAIIGCFQNWFFLEAATMFPDKPGGIALIATEGWKDKFALAGPLASFGYWIGWSAVLSIVGVSAGSIIQAQWFAHSQFQIGFGLLHIELPQIFAIVIILFFWILNRKGIDLAAKVSKFMGAFLLIPVLVLAFNQRQTRLLQQWENEYKSINPDIEIEFLEGQAVKNIVGSDAYSCALKHMGNGHFHSLNMLLGSTQAFLQQGGNL